VLSVEVKNGELQLRIAERTAVDPSRLVRVIGRPGTQIRAYPDRRLGLRLRQPGDALAESFGLLDLLQPGVAASVEEGVNG
jgi:hypothetical protein